MNIIKDQVIYRKKNMAQISGYFLKFDITEAAQENFVSVMREGQALIDFLKNENEISNSVKRRIQNYFIACQESVYAAAIEIPDEYCEAIEILEDLKDQGLLMNEFLNGNLNDAMFN